MVTNILCIETVLLISHDYWPISEVWLNISENQSLRFSYRSVMCSFLGTVTALGCIKFVWVIITLWFLRSMRKSTLWRRSSFIRATALTAMTTTWHWFVFLVTELTGVSRATASHWAASCCPLACQCGERKCQRALPTATSQAGETQVGNAMKHTHTHSCIHTLAIQTSLKLKTCRSDSETIIKDCCTASSCHSWNEGCTVRARTEAVCVKWRCFGSTE